MKENKKRRWLCLALASGILAGLCACGQTTLVEPEPEEEPAQEQTVEEPAAPEEPVEAAPAPEDLYRAVLEQYQAAGGTSYNTETAPYVNTALANLLWSGAELPDLRYSFYDLDGNGVPELFTGYKNDWDGGDTLLDLFTYDGEKPVNPIDGEPWAVEQTEDGILEVYENGVFGMFDHSGTTYFQYDYYKLAADGYMADLEARLILDGETYYLVDGDWNQTEITEAEYNDTIEKFERAKLQLDWKDLSDFVPPEGADAGQDAGTEDRETAGGERPAYPVGYIGMTVGELKSLWGDDISIEDQYVDYDANAAFWYDDERISAVFYAGTVDQLDFSVDEYTIEAVDFNRERLPAGQNHEIADGLTENMTLTDIQASGYAYEFHDWYGESTDEVELWTDVAATCLVHYTGGIDIAYYWSVREENQKPDPASETADIVVVFSERYQVNDF